MCFGKVSLPLEKAVIVFESKHMGEVDLYLIVNILHYLQIVITLPTLIVSFYFAHKLNQLATINSNLKLVVVLPTMSFAACATLHSFGNIIPEWCYSIQDQRFVGATLFYLIMGMNNFGFFIFSFKYTAIAIERTVAYRRMATYDSEGNGFGVKLMVYMVLTSLILFIIKATIIYFYTSDYNLDVRLQKAFIVDKSVVGYMLDVSIASSGMFHTIFVLRGIMAKVQGKFSRSLTQSYEMRQTKYTLEWIKKMVYAFLMLFIVGLPFMGVVSYLHFICGFNTDTVEVQALLCLLLTMVETYNLVCTFFLYHEFPQLKKAVYKDFSCILPKPKDTTGNVTRHEEAEAHFNNLRLMFENENVPVR